jgi:hypothetical protein
MVLGVISANSFDMLRGRICKSICRFHPRSYDFRTSDNSSNHAAKQRARTDFHVKHVLHLVPRSSRHLLRPFHLDYQVFAEYRDQPGHFARVDGFEIKPFAESDPCRWPDEEFGAFEVAERVFERVPHRIAKRPELPADRDHPRVLRASVGRSGQKCLPPARPQPRSGIFHLAPLVFCQVSRIGSDAANQDFHVWIALKLSECFPCLVSGHVAAIEAATFGELSPNTTELWWVGSFVELFPPINREQKFVLPRRGIS